jgi:hypothetical protein
MARPASVVVLGDFNRRAVEVRPTSTSDHAALVVDVEFADKSGPSGPIRR